MSVSYDTPRPVAPGRMTRRSSAPGSLLDRIEKKPLLERLNPEGEKKQTVQKVVPMYVLIDSLGLKYPNNGIYNPTN